MKPILEIKQISKKFRISHELTGYLSFRERLMELLKGSRLKSSEEFWALSDVSFSMCAGQSLGIIGSNGAGKSTLLKILSRITPPTKGKIISRGRVASLLEVGTGFHPELTGRENIFFNGAILGMRRKEIERKFDEIVDFSGVEKFIDTPLKHFSSGMQLRLAFAVAAFLEPEILIIDEVLAVGDMEFQKKCIAKMDNITHQEGRTLMVVSHNMAVLKKLCDAALLLHDGKIVIQGNTEEVISTYQNSYSVAPAVARYGGREATVHNIIVRNEAGRVTDSFFSFERVDFEIECEAKRDFDNLSFSLCFNNIHNTRVISLWTKLINADFNVKRGSFKIRCSIPELRLIPGEYSLVTNFESHGQQIESIDNYKRITIAFKPGKGYVHEPSSSQSLYFEDFKVAVLSDFSPDRKLRISD